MKRMSDQVLICEAIAEVRKELEVGMSWIEQGEVLMRLSALYSLLDVQTIGKVLTVADTRNEHNRRKVA